MNLLQILITCMVTNQPIESALKTQLELFKFSKQNSTEKALSLLVNYELLRLDKKIVNTGGEHTLDALLLSPNISGPCALSG